MIKIHNVLKVGDIDRALVSVELLEVLKGRDSYIDRLPTLNEHLYDHDEIYYAMVNEEKHEPELLAEMKEIFDACNKKKVSYFRMVLE
jgi:hypothetical protein